MRDLRRRTSLLAALPWPSDARYAGFTAFGVEDATRAIDLNGSLATTGRRKVAARGARRMRSSVLA